MAFVSMSKAPVTVQPRAFGVPAQKPVVRSIIRAQAVPEQVKQAVPLATVAAGLLAGPASAANEIMAVSADNRAIISLSFIGLAITWAGINIFGPTTRQVSAMAERNQTGAPKKKPAVAALIGASALALATAPAADAATEAFQTAATAAQWGGIVVMIAPIFIWIAMWLGAEVEPTSFSGKK